jgi:hypothetical protein
MSEHGERSPAEGDSAPEEAKKPQRATRDRRRNPIFETVPVVAISILASVFLFILAAMVSPKAGLLGRMAEPTFARGLITYLFAVVTIGTAVVLLIAGLTHEITEDSKVRFDRGKDILSLLLGVFGTIVGFYFGSAVADTSTAPSAELAVTPPLIGSGALVAGQMETVRAFVSGGTPPYRFGVAFGPDAKLEFTQNVDPVGWITAEVAAPSVATTGSQTITLGVQDAAGQVVNLARDVSVSPPK